MSLFSCKPQMDRIILRFFCRTASPHRRDYYNAPKLAAKTTQTVLPFVTRPAAECSPYIIAQRPIAFRRVHTKDNDESPFHYIGGHTRRATICTYNIIAIVFHQTQKVIFSGVAAIFYNKCYTAGCHWTLPAIHQH